MDIVDANFHDLNKIHYMSFYQLCHWKIQNSVLWQSRPLFLFVYIKI